MAKSVASIFPVSTSTNVRWGSVFRDATCWQEAWPNHKQHLAHRKHFIPPYTYGVQRQTRLRVVDNSKIGREAMAQGKPPMVIGVYSKYRAKRPHHAWGKLGDRVKVAILGLKKEGIIVGLKAKQVHGVPR